MQFILATSVTEQISKLFASVFGQNVWLATVLISIIPIIELKGAIPFGMSKAFWGDNALSGALALFCGLLGGLIVTLLLSFLLNPVVKLLKKTKLLKKITERFERSVKENKTFCNLQKTQNKKIFFKMLGVFLFVTVPLPLTGVWTGAAIAVFSGLNVWQSIVSAFLGNVTAGILITCVCSAFPAFTTILFYIVIAVVVMVVVYQIIKYVLNKQSKS